MMLYHYIVIYETEDEPAQAFLCWADDASHAIEQCELAYPGAYIESAVSTRHKMED